MQRRTFMKQSVFAGFSILAAPTVFARQRQDGFSENTFHLNYAFHDGMFKNHAGDSFLDQIRFGYEMGFRAVEDNGMMDRPASEQKKIGDLIAKLGMQMGVFVLNFDHWPLKTSLTSGDKEWREKFLRSCKEATEVSRRCNGKLVTVVPGNYERKLSIGFQTANVIEALRPACDVFEPHSIVMVLEALSDTPDLFLRHSDQTYAICKAINSPSCKFLFDMYHMQRNEGNIIHNLDAAWDEIGYLQIGDNPGRNEPTTGEMNYRNIFKHIYEKKYNGILGMEHGIAKPGKEGEMELIKAYRQCDNF